MKRASHTGANFLCNIHTFESEKAELLYNFILAKFVPCSLGLAAFSATQKLNLIRCSEEGDYSCSIQ